MNRLRFFILLFFLAVSLPLAFVIWQSYVGLEQEEKAQLRFFSEKLFDQIEQELADLIEIEENRAVDEYQYFMAEADGGKDRDGNLSPLAGSISDDYILGYLQNNPDGTFQTPLVADMGTVAEENQSLLLQIKEANRLFNEKKFNIAKETPQAAIVEKKATRDEKKEGASFSERFLSRSKSAPEKSYLGKKRQRVEEITVEQAYNIASEEEVFRQPKLGLDKARSPSAVSGSIMPQAQKLEQEDVIGLSRLQEEQAIMADSPPESDTQLGFQVEVAPFQSVSIKDDIVYIFRRIVINNQIYRQGFLLNIEPFLQHLIKTHYQGQPLADFTLISMQRVDRATTDALQAGVTLSHADFFAERIFPKPFDFLYVSLKANGMPSSPARNTLNMALTVLGVFMIIGLLAIYQSARAIVLMSEKRSQFVSSVTHELKTPLTNIRMYIEMLEQGVATTPEREQEYLKILGSESSRLSGLINNVLDLAKLEKKQRHFHMQEGNLDDVLEEVETIMSEKLKQEGFRLKIDAESVPVFQYDRDVLIQILMNLIENSIKFGRGSTRREIKIGVTSTQADVLIAVADTGPGIPKRALRKIFDDFYRVDNDLTRKTGGTGIGLALVKKFACAMGGKVEAANNPDGGCTITLSLPRKPQR